MLFEKHQKADFIVETPYRHCERSEAISVPIVISDFYQPTI